MDTKVEDRESSDEYEAKFITWYKEVCDERIAMSEAEETYKKRIKDLEEGLSNLLETFDEAQQETLYLREKYEPRKSSDIYLEPYDIVYEERQKLLDSDRKRKDHIKKLENENNSLKEYVKKIDTRLILPDIKTNVPVKTCPSDKDLEAPVVYNRNKLKAVFKTAGNLRSMEPVQKQVKQMYENINMSKYQKVKGGPIIGDCVSENYRHNTGQFETDDSSISHVSETGLDSRRKVYHGTGKMIENLTERRKQAISKVNLIQNSNINATSNIHHISGHARNGYLEMFKNDKRAWQKYCQLVKTNNGNHLKANAAVGNYTNRLVVITSSKRLQKLENKHKQLRLRLNDLTQENAVLIERNNKLQKKTTDMHRDTIAYTERLELIHQVEKNFTEMQTTSLKSPMLKNTKRGSKLKSDRLSFRSPQVVFPVLKGFGLKFGLGYSVLHRKEPSSRSKVFPQTGSLAFLNTNHYT